MKRLFPRVSSIILFAVFAFFFASTNLFVHTHDGPNGKIIHSHPWSGKPHDHNSSQFQLISMLSACEFDVSPVLDNIETFCSRTIVLEFDNINSGFYSRCSNSLCLRGPPMFV